VARRHRDLGVRFQEVVAKGQPRHVVVLAGPAQREQPLVVRMAPVIKNGAVDSVHMTLVSLGSGG
jgi:hypothetical protein